MYKTKTGYVFSASDLILYMRSEFASWMNRLALDYPQRVENIERDQDEMMGLLAEKGHQHEAHFLKQLQQEYGVDNVAIIRTPREQAFDATIAAMKSGIKVIFQAYLKRDDFAGFADFIIRRDDGVSKFGDFYYEAWDTKLSKSTRPYFLIQLCCYSWMLEAIQGVRPEETAVVLGDNSQDRFRIAAYYSYFEQLKQRFLQAQSDFTDDETTRPDPALYSDHGNWSSYAQTLMEESDSLALVANIRKSQIKRLHDVGITTLSQLAQTDTETVKGISNDTYTKLRQQADIQLRSRGKEVPEFSVIRDDNGKGLSALPPPCALDVFFDIEGHPLLEGGLEYLWGVSYFDTQAVQGKLYAFKDWWAHTREQEKHAFEGFIDWVYSRWQQDPSMHVYHYASYEVTAIKKISAREETRQKEVGELLANGVFIDLYKLVKNGLLIGEPRYSIKNVEHLYRGKRNTDVANGGESVVVYENWREAGGVEEWNSNPKGYQNWLADPDNFDWTQWQVLKDIRDYNIDDCESTLDLVCWLREQMEAAGITYQPPKEEPEKEKTQRQLSNQQIREELEARQQALIEKFNQDEILKSDRQAGLLISLLHFYQRERKPQNWAYYERLEKSGEELFDDDTVLYNIDLQTTDYDEGKIHCSAYYDKDQPVRIDKFDTAVIKDSDIVVNNIRFKDISPHQGEVRFTLKAEEEEGLQLAELTLFANETVINTTGLENRLCEITERYFETGQLDGVLETILKQAAPRFKSGQMPLPVSRTRYPDDEDYLMAMVTAVKALDNSCLCIQGPPGAGKTYTAKHVISHLVNDGKRVGIMSNSHAAIMNLMKALPDILPEARLVKIGNYKNNDIFREHYPEEAYPHFDYRTSMRFTKKAPFDSYDVVGATVYGFAKEVTHETPLDYLFIDEASQVALANLIAVTGATRNIILMGDQMQLEQPIQGSHPDDAGKSALEFMLQGHAVIPDDQGIFLERTYRMHPDVCQPLSEVVYEGKLKSDKQTEIQSINLPAPTLITKASGILPIRVQHEGNTQSSLEEVEMVQKLIDELKTGIFTDNKGKQHEITDHDILVVAPYNMQVNLLKEKLNGDIKVGTIDKFQGQEAPVVIISMAVSDVEDASRGLDFVFDINRLNVAVSRAQALAIIVANEGLENCHVNSLGQMEKVGLYLKLQ